MTPCLSPWRLGTRWKLRIGTLLARPLCRVLSVDRVIRRKGLRYRVDLREGIDLCLFLTGDFQPHVTRSPCFRVGEDWTIFDVGANRGVMSLRFARQATRGRVYAFEPSAEGFVRLAENLRLNPETAARIHPVPLFLSDRRGAPVPPSVQWSWPLVSGIPSLSSTLDGETETLDGFAESRGIGKVDLIKVDTDGWESAVLRGAEAILRRDRPVVIAEGPSPELRQYLVGLGYRLRCAVTGGPVGHGEPLGMRDVVALPERAP
jgi:FkbM family methyltransferase